ncbi:MAG TPA: ExbD/TolR family protein [Xanthobacteraceae bacterium]|jgi:biopolymer transport protein TolR
MGMSGTAGNAVGKRVHRRHAVMSEINVTPMVDVMLVLLIVFMVSAPLLTVGIPIELPETRAKSLAQSQHEPLVLSINDKGQIFLGAETSELPIAEMVAKLKAVTAARGGTEERIYVKGAREAQYYMVARVLGMLQAAGFRQLELVTLPERES